LRLRVESKTLNFKLQTSGKHQTLSAKHLRASGGLRVESGRAEGVAAAEDGRTPAGVES
jgi:hypothetical protein